MSEEDKGFTIRDAPGLNPEAQAADKAGATAWSDRCGPRRTGPLPPVDFAGFVLGLAQMAFVHLGEIVEPQAGERCQDLEQARHTIDLLGLLEAKTKGNLSEEEASLLSHLVTDLKLRYVRLTK
jgi:hypothetical protein